MTSLCLLRDGFSGNLASLLSIGREAIERNRTKTGEGKCKRDELQKQTLDLKNEGEVEGIYRTKEVKNLSMASSVQKKHVLMLSY